VPPDQPVQIGGVRALPAVSYGSQPKETSMNGWANYETWNASLWMGNDEFLYRTALACVEFAEEGESPWIKFIRCMTNGSMETTGDGVRWDDPAIDAEEMEEMMEDL
tara:strand:- start:556 stop:876 length:321 start_codon:yes stop_codon:yes gene_type:complete